MSPARAPRRAAGRPDACQPQPVPLSCAPHRGDRSERHPVIRRRTLLSTALATGAAIGLAACTGDEGSDASDGGSDASDGGGNVLDAVTVSEDLGAEPTIEFDAPLSVSAPDARVVVAGDGDQIAEGDVLVWRSVYVNAETGEVIQSWWQGAPAGGVVVGADALGEYPATFLQSVTVGSRFMMAGWQQYPSTQEMLSLIQVADIDRIVTATRAEGKAASPSGSYPEVTLGDDGAPSIAGPAQGDPPSTTVAEMLIQGTGEPTREGDFLTMQYTGWTFDDGEKFDSSWDRGAPFQFAQGQGQVIAGWDSSLVDVPVGSQLMLVIPPEEAYGTDENQSELANRTLIFVVDVLDAAHTNA